MQAGGQRFESVILHDSGEQDGRSASEVNSKPDTVRAVIWKEFFDILAHKTVSKDNFISDTLRDDESQFTAESMSIPACIMHAG